MEEILSREKMLEGYPKIENIDELFDADILILPAEKTGEGAFVNQLTPYDIERVFPNTKVKYYCKSEPEFYCIKYNQAPIVIDIPGAVVLLNSISVQIFLKYLYNFYKNSLIDIEIFRKFGDKGYVRLSFKNNIGNDVADLQRKIEELEEMLNENSI